MVEADFPALVLPFQLEKKHLALIGKSYGTKHHLLTYIYIDLTSVFPCLSPTIVWFPAGELLAYSEYSSPLGICILGM